MEIAKAIEGLTLQVGENAAIRLEVGELRARQRPPLADLQAIEARRDDLFSRLQQGYQRSEAKLDSGENATHWEDLWLTLLDEYEAVCLELQRDLAI